MENLRTRQILAYLKSRKSCSLEELMKKFDVSSATIHRDAELLSRRGVVERVRGGLVYHDAPDSHGDAIGYQNRVVANRTAKVTVARKALSLVEEGDIIFLDSSTTVFELAILLIHAKFDHLTVITNAVPVMHLFRKFPTHWSLIGLGGNYDPQLNSILGMAALDQLSHFNVTKAFVSAFGLDDKTATTNHERQAEILRRVLDMADRHYLLVDHTKLGRKGLYRIAARGGFDSVITD